MEKENQMTSNKKETREIFKGLSFANPPVSRKEYIEAYGEYVRRCSVKDYSETYSNYRNSGVLPSEQ